MSFRNICAATAVAWLVAACGGGMEVGGPGPGANDETFVQDDPMAGGGINEGTGSVIP